MELLSAWSHRDPGRGDLNDCFAASLSALVAQRAAPMPVSDKVAAMFAAQEARNAELDRRLPEIAAKAEKERNQKLDAELAKESPRLCKDLNARDPTTILGLATNLWSGARQAKVTGVMRERLLIGAKGFSPIREELAYPFEPPLASVEEVSKRFAALRGEALRPAFDAVAMLLIFMATCLLGAHFTTWAVFDWVRVVARYLFGRYDAAVMELCVNFMFAAHAAEAAYAGALARSLGLDARSVMGWTLRTFIAGVGALGRLMRLANTTTLPGYEKCGVKY